MEHKLAGVLSLDTAGPLKPAYDHGILSRYFLVGTLTWAAPTQLEEEVEAIHIAEEEDMEEEWPEIEEKKPEEANEEEERRGGLTDAEEEAEEDLYPKLHEPYEAEENEDDHFNGV